MSDKDKKAIQVNWRAVGRFLFAVLKFVRWPLSLYLIAQLPNYWQSVHPDWELLLKYVNVAIWPFVVLCILRAVHGSLPGLMDRLAELSIFGGRAKFNKAQGQANDDQGEDLRGLAPDASEPNTKTANDFQITDDDTHALLTSYDAAVAFAQVYGTIFGTQINALRLLVDYPDGLKRADLDDILKEHKRRSNGKGFDNMVTFMQYPMRNTLVRYDDEKYQLTIAGFYFLAFLHKSELLDRPKDW
jgi:hypothetical protein